MGQGGRPAAADRRPPARPRLRRAGLIALALAGLSLLAETAFTGDVDAAGVLRESLFLPLGALLAGLGPRAAARRSNRPAGAHDGLGPTARPRDSRQGTRPNWQACFQPLSSRIPAPENHAFSEACAQFAAPERFLAPFPLAPQSTPSVTDKAPMISARRPAPGLSAAPVSGPGIGTAEAFPAPARRARWVESPRPRKANRP